MENLNQYAQILALILTAYFVLMVGSGLVNFLLRYIDRLSIDKEDAHAFRQNIIKALGFGATAALFDMLPFFMVVCILLCGIVLYLLFNIEGCSGL